MPEPVLEVEGLSKAFGALRAVSDVTLDILQGQIHAVIGPNGAGKTTFLNLLSGELAPSAGTIRLNGTDVTGLTPDALARAGLGRTFQHSSVMQSFSIFENVRLAAQVRSPAAYRLFSSADRLKDTSKRAAEAISVVGISKSERSAAVASHGEKRQLEIAMLVATGAEVMLLDEPTSGMGRAETMELIPLLRKLKGTKTVLLVEHDLDAVFTLADRITVLVYGKVLATGTPDEVRRNPDVRAAYLGERLG